MTSSVFYRFFKCTNQTFIDRVSQILDEKEIATKAILDFTAEIGAEEVRQSSFSSQLIGFVFNQSPDNSIWKKPHKKTGLVWPRSSTKAGKAMLDRIADLPKIPSLQSAVTLLGLPDGIILIDNALGRGMGAAFSGNANKGVFFIKVPWRSVEDDAMQSYLQRKSSSDYRDSEMDHLLWDPSKVDGLVEVKEWEMLKGLDELGLKA